MNNYEFIVDEFFNALQSRVITIEEALNNIDKLIETNIDLAEVLVKEMRRRTDIGGTVTVNYLANKISEKRFDLGMSPEVRARYDEYMRVGKQALKNKSFQKAKRVFSEAYDEIAHPLFMYYKGKSSFYLKEHDEAVDCFHKYISMGSENFGKSNMYLYGLARIRGRERERRYRAALLYHFPFIFDSEEHRDSLVRFFKTPPSRERILPSCITFKNSDESSFNVFSNYDESSYVYVKKDKNK